MAARGFDWSPFKSLGKSKTLWKLLGRAREDIAARINFAKIMFYCRGCQGVSGKLAHRIRHQRAGSAVRITRFAVSGGASNASAGRWNREEDPGRSFA